MFGKSKAPGSDDARPAAAETAARTPEPPRRAGYAPPGGLRRDARMPAARPAGPERQLVVGREISLAGQITACEQLVVEGKVEADLKHCRDLRIAVSGLYKGAATVEQADISGHFDGELTVTGTLTLRSTGRVSGSLRYGEMEIERGGKVSGSLEDIPPGAPQAETRPARAPATPSRPAAPEPAAPDDLVTRAQSGGTAS